VQAERGPGQGRPRPVAPGQVGGLPEGPAGAGGVARAAQRLAQPGQQPGPPPGRERLGGLLREYYREAA